MLRVHLTQNRFALSDPAMEEALYEIARGAGMAAMWTRAAAQSSVIADINRCRADLRGEPLNGSSGSKESSRSKWQAIATRLVNGAPS
jgi:hypothetical protein